MDDIHYATYEVLVEVANRAAPRLADRVIRKQKNPYTLKLYRCYGYQTLLEDYRVTASALFGVEEAQFYSAFGKILKPLLKKQLCRRTDKIVQIKRRPRNLKVILSVPQKPPDVKPVSESMPKAHKYIKLS